MADLGTMIGLILLGQGQAGQVVPVTLTLSGALVPSLTSPTITLSKKGAAYASPSDGAWTELAGGDYTIQLDSTDTNTLGWLLIRVTHGSADEARIFCSVGVSPSEQRADMIRTRHMKGQR